MKKTEKRKIGDLGENIACKYLEKRGFRVVGRNYLKPWGEIDIIVEKANLLSFVEVKSVRRNLVADVPRESMRPEDNMHPAKMRRLHRAVQTYLLDHRVPENIEWRIDLACVYLDFSTRRARVEIIENVIL